MKALKLSVIALAVLVMSCQKEQLLTPVPGSGSTATTEQVVDAQDEGRIPGTQARIELEEGPMTQEQADYMNSLPDATEAEMDNLQSLLSKLTYSPGTENQQVWGCGIDNRVWKWNGSNWFEPAPGAILQYIEVGASDGSIWGIGLSNELFRVVGTALVEPNPLISLYKVAALSNTIAFGIGPNGKLFFTVNGGQDWAPIAGTNFYNEICTGNGNTLDNALYGVKDNGTTKHLQDNVFVTLSNAPAAVSDISTGPIPGWVVVRESGTEKVWVSGDNGFSWNVPNSSAQMRVISCRNPQAMWAVGPNLGNGGRVYKSTNNGATWFEPNSAARLRHITSDY